MSLTAFHIFFITISILLDGFVAYWSATHSQTGLLLFSAVSGVALVAYLLWKIKKDKKSALALLLIPFLPQSSHACAVCFGLVDFEARNANNNAILFLLGLTALMLVSVSYFVVKTLRSLPKN